MSFRARRIKFQRSSAGALRGIAVLIMVLAPTAVRAGGEEGGGGEIVFAPPQKCITPTDEALAQQLIDDYVKNFGPLSFLMPGQAPPRLAFEPIGGRLWGDVFTLNYVDMNPTNAAHDFDCLSYTYNGHTGHDTMLRTFDEQEIGVPVFAAFDGIVVAVHDGEPDMNIDFEDVPANFVVIDHGFGRLGRYWHLKSGSIIVAPSQLVSAGDAIAQVGSSGMSSGPHLHFEIQEDGVAWEPYAGDCREGQTGWQVQPVPERDLYLMDFGLTQENLSSHPGWPYRWPNTSQIVLTDSGIRVWFLGANLPASSNWQVKFRRPDGVVLSAPVQQFLNPFWEFFSWWWPYDVADMHTIPGAWQVLLHINGVLHVEAPLQVVFQPSPGANVPPQPITLQFDPPSPRVGDSLAVLVQSSLTLDDLDYDLVRYRYLWSIDETVVRDVITAGQSDVLSRSLLKSHAVASCEVTPMDEVSSGPTRFIASRIAAPPIPAASAWSLIVLLLTLTTAATLLLRARCESDSHA